MKYIILVFGDKGEILMNEESSLGETARIILDNAIKRFEKEEENG